MAEDSEVLAEVRVESLYEGVQITEIDVEGESETEQFDEPGTYRLVRDTDN